MEGNKEETIGFHKGALSTLVKERQELLRLINIVEQLMQLHAKALKELGVDIEKEEKQGAPQGEQKPIEDILKKDNL